MPKKKTSHLPPNDAASSQAVKRFKADPGCTSSNGAEPTATRRSLRTRSQDENTNVENTNRSTRAAGKQFTEEVTSSRPKRAALQTTPERRSTRGAGFVVANPSPTKASQAAETTDKYSSDLSLQVTPCELSKRMDQATVTDTATSRKRKVKSSPNKTTEKKSRAAASNSSSPSAQSAPQSEEDTPVVEASSLRECSVKLDVNRSLSRTSSTADKHYLTKDPESITSQEGLPKSLPSTKEDPLFTRRIIQLDNETTNVDPSCVFSVLTYNILAECHRLRMDASYNYTDDVHKDMEYRDYRILEEIKHFDCDVVCMQEVEEIYYRHSLIKSMQMLGYEGLFHKRVGDNYPEGAATFYKSSQFKLNQQENSSYTQLAHDDIDVSEHTEEVKQCLKLHVEKEAVVTACRLTHIASNKHIVIGNTHLTWAQFTDLDISTLQAAYAFKLLDRLSGHGETPILFVGDFNSLNTHPAYQLCTDGYLNEDSIKTLQKLKTVTLPDGSKKALVDLLWCAFKHPTRDVRSTYLTVQGCEPEVTSRNFLMNHSVDYMWYNQINPLSVAQVNKIEHNMPNIIYPSDHVSLQAKYTFL